MIKKLGLAAALSALLLSGCGGGGSDVETTTTPTTTTPTTKSITNIDYIQGIYNISDNGNTFYLSINQNGVLSTYDYQADDFGNGNDCYIKNDPSYKNSNITGKTITNNEVEKYFYIDDYRWEYNDGTDIETVSYAGTISAGTILSINDIRFATSKQLVTSLSEGELELYLCK